MNDMTKVIVPKSDQLNSDDLIAGPITITITEVKIAPGEQPVAISFDGDAGKPWKPCKSMSRVLVAAWGPDAKAYVGRSATLYRDPTVKWGGMEVGGIRVSHLSNIDKVMVLALTATKGSRKPFTVKPLAAAAPKKAGSYDFLAGIEACPGPGALRQWWKDHNETIPDTIYDDVLAAFNARSATFKSQTRPSTARAPADDADNQGGDHGGADQEGRDTADMGEPLSGPALAAQMKDEIAAIKGMGDLARWEGDHDAAIASLDEGDVAEIAAALAGKRAALAGRG